MQHIVTRLGGRTMRVQSATAVGRALLCLPFLVLPCRGQDTQPPTIVGPADILHAVRQDVLSVETVERWAGLAGMRLVARGHLRIVQRPLRLEGGAEIEPPGLAQTISNFLRHLSPIEMAALAAGRALRLKTASQQAVELLRAGVPDWMTFNTGRVAPARRLDDRDRADIEEMMRRPIDEGEWRRRVAESERRAALRSRFGAVPHEIVVHLGLAADLVLVGDDGEALSSSLPVLRAIGLRPPALRPWDEASFVPAPRPGLGTLDPCYRWLEHHADVPPVVRIESSGLHQLGDLVARLDPRTPRRVERDLAEEKLYIAAGEYEDELFGEAMQRASGLLWRQDKAAPGGLVLALAPPAATEALPLWSALLPHAQALADAVATDGSPFAMGDLLDPNGGSIERPFDDLTAEQRDWILERATAPQQMGDGRAVALTPPALTAADCIGSVVRFQVRVSCFVAQVAVVPDETGNDLAVLLSANGLGVPIGNELAARLAELAR